MGEVKVHGRSARRRWVAVTGVGFAVALAAAVAGLVPLALAGLLAFLVGGAGTTISVSNIGDRRASVLDERQLARRDRAYRLAYGAIGWPLSFLLVYLMFVLASGRPLLPEEFVQVGAVVLAGAIMLVVLLPTAILAWTEPDPPEDEER
jgi:hypothetical protein